MGDPILMRKIMKPKPWIQRNDKKLQRLFLVEIAGNTAFMDRGNTQETRDLVDENTKRNEIKRAQ
jgi:hypothetical protein